MGQALDWPNLHLVGFPRLADGRGTMTMIDGVAYRGRDLTPSDEPSNTLTEKARSWKVYAASSTHGDTGSRTLTDKHRNLLLSEAQILQGFPPDYTFTGTRTSQFLQVANAVPPKMAELLATANKA